MRVEHSWLAAIIPPLDERLVVSRPQRIIALCVLLLANMFVSALFLGTNPGTTVILCFIKWPIACIYLCALIAAVACFQVINMHAIDAFSGGVVGYPFHVNHLLCNLHNCICLFVLQTLYLKMRSWALSLLRS